jgi:hypothetical protein
MGHVGRIETRYHTFGPSFNGATYDLVMDMMRGFFDKGYSLYCDNYYTSPQLFCDLFQLGTYATGTVRQNRRGIPQSLKDYQLRNRGDMFVMNNGQLESYKHICLYTIFHRFIRTVDTKR